MAKRYTENRRKSIISKYKNGCNASKLCRKHGIACRTIFVD